MLRELLKQDGIDTGNIITVNDRPTTVKTRIMASGQHILRIDEEISDDLDTQIQEQLKENFDKLTEEIKIDAVIFQDYNKGLLNDNIINHIISKCREKVYLPLLIQNLKIFSAIKMLVF